MLAGVLPLAYDYDIHIFGLLKICQFSANMYVFLYFIMCYILIVVNWLQVVSKLVFLRYKIIETFYYSVS